MYTSQTIHKALEKTNALGVVFGHFLLFMVMYPKVYKCIKMQYPSLNICVLF
jgi:hypothetical protein